MKALVKCILVLSLFVFIAGSSIAAEKPDIGFKGIGARLGYVDLEDWDGTFNFGAVADLGTWMEYLKWDASIEYWSSSQTIFSNDLTISDIAFRSGVLYEFMHEKIRPRAGGGLGLHMLSAESAYVNPFTGHSATASSDDTKFGIYLQGGAETDLSAKWKGAADIRLDFVEDANQTHIMFTAIYMLGK
jgi:opacity protein-like surface antigen